MKKSIGIIITVSVALLGLGCGGGGENKPPESTLESNKTGVFRDNEVEGMYYETESGSGLTDSSGRFSYKIDEKVRFYVGDILLGEAQGEDVITPVDLVDGASGASHPTAINIARFLISIDDDNDLSNGINISENVRNLCENKSIDFDMSTSDFENDGEIQVLVSTLTSATIAGSRSLVSAVFAQQHLQNTIDSILGTGEDKIQLLGPDTSLIGEDFIPFMAIRNRNVVESGGVMVRAVDVRSTLEMEDDEFILDAWVLNDIDLQSTYGFQRSVTLKSVKNGVMREYGCKDDSCGEDSIIIDVGNRKLTLIDTSVKNEQSGELILLSGSLSWQDR